MDVNKQLLETRITIIQVRENYSFLHKIEQYKIKLQEYFKTDYSEFDIGNALTNLEEAYLNHEYEQAQQVLEIPEDFELK